MVIMCCRPIEWWWWCYCAARCMVVCCVCDVLVLMLINFWRCDLQALGECVVLVRTLAGATGQKQN
jgi:hypothetical protein